MTDERTVEFKSSNLKARITKTAGGDVILAMDSKDGFGGAIIMSSRMLQKFAEALGWAKGRVEQM